MRRKRRLESFAGTNASGREGRTAAPGGRTGRDARSDVDDLVFVNVAVDTAHAGGYLIRLPGALFECRTHLKHPKILAFISSGNETARRHLFKLGHFAYPRVACHQGIALGRVRSLFAFGCLCP